MLNRIFEVISNIPALRFKKKQLKMVTYICNLLFEITVRLSMKQETTTNYSVFERNKSV